MKTKYFLVSLMLVLSLANAAKIYELHLTIYKNDTVVLNGFDTREGEVSIFPTSEDNNYEFRIISGGDTTLFSQPFHLGFVAYRFQGPNATEPSVVPYDQVEDYWNLPYYENAALIQLFHDGRKIFEYELPQQTAEEEPGETPEKPVEKPFDSNLIICATCGSIAILALVAYALFRYAGKKGGRK
ncbi:hypothetical protein H0O00_05750 [Candidatus Micrarchaeota archaeon]|nr:hypothetical protein [Candidatus Micrarchaeota archaeon]